MQTLSIGRKKRIYAIAFSPDGDELAAVCGDFQIRIWNLITGEVRRSAPIEDISDRHDIAYLDDYRLVHSGIDLRWWDIARDAWHQISLGSPCSRHIAISPDGEYFVEVDQSLKAVGRHGTGLLARATANWELFPPMDGSENTTGGAAFSRDSRFLASGHWTIVGQKTRSFGMLPGHQYQIDDLDYLVQVREMPSGRVLQTLDGWQQGVAHLAFSPDGSVLAGTAGPRLRIWDLESNQEIVLHKRGTKHFQGLSFMHDGRYLATVSNDTTVRIWDARTWEEHTTFTWQIGALLNIAFAPDGLRAAAGSDKGQIVIWDVE